METTNFIVDIFTYIIQMVTIIYLLTSVFYAYNIRTKMNKRNAIALSSISLGLVFGMLLHTYVLIMNLQNTHVSLMFSINQIMICFGVGGIVYNFLIRKLNRKPFEKIIHYFFKRY